MNLGVFVVLAAFAVGSAHAEVSVQDGNILCDGKAITSGGSDEQPALSPDGHTVAFIRNLQVDSGDDGPMDTASLWIGDCTTGSVRQLLAPKPDNDTAERNLRQVYNPVFSLDGSHVYIMATAWVTSDALHAVDVTTGAETYLIDGNTDSVIRTGPYSGDLLVQRHRYYRGGGSYNPTYVITPAGKTVLKVPGTDNEETDEVTTRWLTKHKWTAW